MTEGKKRRFGLSTEAKKGDQLFPSPVLQEEKNPQKA